jgi:hypothetical protein
MIASAVYLLCALTSFLCATLLIRSFRKAHLRLIFWSSVFFICTALSNILLFIDLAVFPNIDLSFLRTFLALVGVILLLYGLVWEGDR